MKYLIIVLTLWFLGGFISLVVLRRYKLPMLYKILLFIEGLLGLLFILFFKGTINDKKNTK